VITVNTMSNEANVAPRNSRSTMSPDNAGALKVETRDSAGTGMLIINADD
jgi:hypothetical protein